MHKSLKFIIYILRHFIVAPEFLVILVALWAWEVIPCVKHLVSNMSVEKEYVRWGAGIAIGLLAFIVKNSYEIILPGHSDGAKVIAWPMYAQLMACFYVTLFYALTSVLTYCVVMLSSSIDPGLRMYLLIICVAVLLVDVCTCYISRIKMLQVLKCPRDA